MAKFKIFFIAFLFLCAGKDALSMEVESNSDSWICEMPERWVDEIAQDIWILIFYTRFEPSQDIIDKRYALIELRKISEVCRGWRNIITEDVEIKASFFDHIWKQKYPDYYWLDDLIPLHFAAARGIQDLVIHYMKYQCVNDLSNKHFLTPLHYAASNGRAKIVKILLTSPTILVDIQDSLGRTPLMVATASDRVEVVMLLLGSDKELGLALTCQYQYSLSEIDMINPHATALDIACYNGFSEIAEIIRDHTKTRFPEHARLNKALLPSKHI